MCVCVRFILNVCHVVEMFPQFQFTFSILSQTFQSRKWLIWHTAQRKRKGINCEFPTWGRMVLFKKSMTPLQEGEYKMYPVARESVAEKCLSNNTGMTTCSGCWAASVRKAGSFICYWAFLAMPLEPPCSCHHAGCWYLTPARDMPGLAPSKEVDMQHWPSLEGELAERNIGTCWVGTCCLAGCPSAGSWSQDRAGTLVFPCGCVCPRQHFSFFFSAPRKSLAREKQKDPSLVGTQTVAINHHWKKKMTILALIFNIDSILIC